MLSMFSRSIFIVPLIWVLAIITLAPSCPNKSPEYYYSLADRKRAEGDNLVAIKCLSKAIKDKPDYLDAYKMRADLWLKEDSIDRAVDDLTKIIDLKPSGDAYFQRGNAYYVGVKDSLACKDYYKACDLNHNKSCDLWRKYCK